MARPHHRNGGGADARMRFPAREVERRARQSSRVTRTWVDPPGLRADLGDRREGLTRAPIMLCRHRQFMCELVAFPNVDSRLIGLFAWDAAGYVETIENVRERWTVGRHSSRRYKSNYPDFTTGYFLCGTGGARGPSTAVRSPCCCWSRPQSKRHS